MTRAFDLLGNIAIVNFPRNWKLSEKKKKANEILKSNKSIKTVLEKSGKVKGRLRKPETKFLAGERTKEAKYSENNCVFRFNVDTTYFSPRLSNERKEIAGEIKKGESVFVAFAGVAPFSIVIAKNSKAGRVVSNELNRVANKYGRLNAELNKVKDKIEFWDGDVKKVVGKYVASPATLNPRPPLETIESRDAHPPMKKVNDKLDKFDVIVMPRPQLKSSFLEDILKLAKKGTRVYYYDFCGFDETDKIVEKVKDDSRKAGKKIKILRIKKAGEIAPYRIRVRVDFKVV